MQVKKIFFSIFSVIFIFSTVSAQYKKQFDVTKYGSVGDGKTNNTNFINLAIKECAEAGGGNVYFPNGTYLSSTIHLKSNVNIVLGDSLEIKAIDDINLYDHLTSDKTLEKYNTISDQGNNANSAFDTIWTKAFLLGENVHDIKIMGKGSINGIHLFNPNGEEKMRGPHGIILSNSYNISFQDVTIKNAANYAILGYQLKNVRFKSIKIQQGWDGIHIRGGEKINIENCQLETGDDAIAGGYWSNFNIYNCRINSSCNGIRIIMPVNGVYIHDNIFEGPGKYPHRTSGVENRTNMLVGVYIQPGGWGETKGDIKNVNLKNLQFNNMDHVLMAELNKENNSDNIQLENITAKDIRGDIYFNSHFGGIFRNVCFKNVKVNYTYAEPREHWALNLNHIEAIDVINSIFTSDINKTTNAFDMKSVNRYKLKKVVVNNKPYGK